MSQSAKWATCFACVCISCLSPVWEEREQNVRSCMLMSLWHIMSWVSTSDWELPIRGGNSHMHTNLQSHLPPAWCRWRRSSLSQCWPTHFQSPRWSGCSGRSRAKSRSCYALTGRPRAPHPSLKQVPPTRSRNLGRGSRFPVLWSLVLTCSTGCCWLGRWWRPVLSGTTESTGYPGALPAHRATLERK